MKKRMYKENIKSINWFVGCGHRCVYCEPSFQRQAKRSRKHCQKHYDYEPHAHLEKLLKAPPITQNISEFVFFPSLGDPAFASLSELRSALDYVEEYPATTFLMQTKNPTMFLLTESFPSNLILGITLETNQRSFRTPSRFHMYSEISDAPNPLIRKEVFRKVKHFRKMVTVEPILDFEIYSFADDIQKINPEVAYVGYDNHNCRLPEPKLHDTKLLVERLREFTEVRVKTLRKAWWEQ